MRKIVLLCLGIALLAVPSAASRRKVLLQLDYRKQASWAYILDYRSECVIVESGSTSKISTSVVCNMTARPEKRGDRMIFTIDSAAVASELFTGEQQISIDDKLTGAHIALALFGGCPVVDTLSTFSVSELSEWDLVIQFAKLLPYIPRQPVKKGYKWEESGVHLITTSLGPIPCEIYRLYKIDSLTAKGNLAHISWNFSYAAAQLGTEDMKDPKRVPVSGKGSGTASIDIAGQVLRKASVTFHTPIATVGNVQMNWVENTVLEYQP